MGQEPYEQLCKVTEERGRPFRILIVDDEQWVREVFRDFCDLTNAFEVELAPDGRAALEMVRTGSYDLVTLDLIMPEMSGLEVLTAIKEVAPKIPVIVITGNATDSLVTRAGVLGACRVMYKPVILEQFLNEIAVTLAPGLVMSRPSERTNASSEAPR